MKQDMTSALAAPGSIVPATAQRSVFQTADLFCADDLDDSDLAGLFPTDHRHAEFRDGRLRSFFCGRDSHHIVLKSKELAVARPHGHLLRSGKGFSPDSELMSCTRTHRAFLFRNWHWETPARESCFPEFGIV